MLRYTHRETEVLHLVELGLSNAEIAGRLDITRGTVKVHLRNANLKNGKLTSATRISTVRDRLRTAMTLLADIKFGTPSTSNRLDAILETEWAKEAIK